MTKPNFFIIGAPKCGTTSLFDWLSLHPEIFVSPNKEPNFFSSDIWVPNRITEAEYLKLFEKVPEYKKNIGEASTRYLYSEVAIDKILKYCDKPRFIALVRNPVDMVYSLYNHLQFLNVEDCQSFSDAWALKDARADGKCIKPGCTDPASLSYGKIGLLGEQVERFYAKVPASQRLVVVMDDLKKDPESVWVNVLKFLGVADDIPIDFFVSNKSMKPRFKSLNQMVFWLSSAKRKIGINRGVGILNRVSKFNRVQAVRKPLEEDLKLRITDYFSEDILKLGNVLNRDFSNWLN